MLHNPRRVSGARWNHGLAALIRLYEWAAQRNHVPVNPVIMRSVIGRSGQRVLVSAARAKNARTSEARWLTPRAFRRWVEVGLRGHGADGGIPDIEQRLRKQIRRLPTPRRSPSSRPTSRPA
ncbi:hypothetical protein ACIPWL_08115 [Streptomyces sp. NPDC090023]|uniref:hypothetical protein n=1 Tax=unclassified Streptomyces TaxID=2593676 RepID=UPI0038240B98